MPSEERHIEKTHTRREKTENTLNSDPKPPFLDE
jgi:hypothetical protein